MSSMFEGATSANPDVTNWNVSKVIYMDFMFDNSGFSTANYDALLIKLAGTSLDNVTLGAMGVSYSSNAARG